MKAALFIVSLLAIYGLVARLDMDAEQATADLLVEHRIIWSTADVGMERAEDHRVAVLTLEPDCR